jgi:hypothetical protein
MITFILDRLCWWLDLLRQRREHELQYRRALAWLREKSLVARNQGD